MTQIEKDTILDFASSDISLNEFYKKLPNYRNDNFLLQKYLEAIKLKNKEYLSYLRLVPINNISLFEGINRELLCEKWHIENEDIVTLFQFTWNNNIENIPILLKAINNIPEYLQDEISKYSYIKKIIYAIGAQPQPESLLALEKLASETNDTEIKKLALHQLEKRIELGRWEYEKNVIS